MRACRVHRAVAVLASLLSIESCASGGSPAGSSTAAGPTPAARQRIESADQLPLHVYRVATTASALFEDSAQFAAMARQLEADLRADLATYDIQDRATLKRYFSTLDLIVK